MCVRARVYVSVCVCVCVCVFRKHTPHHYVASLYPLARGSRCTVCVRECYICSKNTVYVTVYWIYRNDTVYVRLGMQQEYSVYNSVLDI